MDLIQVKSQPRVKSMPTKMQVLCLVPQPRMPHGEKAMVSQRRWRPGGKTRKLGTAQVVGKVEKRQSCLEKLAAQILHGRQDQQNHWQLYRPRTAGQLLCHLGSSMLEVPQVKILRPLLPRVKHLWLLHLRLRGLLLHGARVVHHHFPCLAARRLLQQPHQETVLRGTNRQGQGHCLCL